MKKSILVFLLGSAAAVAALAVYGIRHIDEFMLDDDDFADDGDEGFYDDDIADDYDDDDYDNGAKDAVPDVSGISAGLKA